MKITVCIGSSCHLKGSRKIVEELQYLISENKLKEKVELSGMFCMGKCQQGVCVTKDCKLFSLTPETTKNFFETDVLGKR
jgi:NADH:ubiquinone oxidoreductase subunit E